MAKRYWTKEEEEYLESRWGVNSIKSIAKKLERTVNAVKLKARRMGLIDARFCIDGITINQLMIALNMDFKKANRWIDKLEFPVKSKVLCRQARVRYVDYEGFWKWAESNKREINWARVEKNILGVEPKWVDEWRRKDYYNRLKKRMHNDPWTKEEDNRLTNMLNAYKYTYTDISRVLNRTEGAIKRRMIDLNLRQRPVRRKARLWTDEETKTLVFMYKQGYGLHEIGEKLDKTALAVRGKLERMEIV